MNPTDLSKMLHALQSNRNETDLGPSDFDDDHDLNGPVYGHGQVLLEAEAWD